MALSQSEDNEHLGGYALESQAREVLLGLGFNGNGCMASATATINHDDQR